MEKYRNKRMVIRKGGRYAKLTAADVGIGAGDNKQWYLIWRHAKRNHHILTVSNCRRGHECSYQLVDE